MRDFLQLTLFFWVFSASVLAAPDRALRLVIDQAPVTLNPRMALDASGQRIGALIFLGLTQISADFEATPGLAESWSANPRKTTWKFVIAAHQRDHDGRLISTQDVFRCLENYRSGTPRSLVGTNFLQWQSTRLVTPRTIEIRLTESDPYFPKNASLLRFFRVENQEAPCIEPAAGQKVIGSGPLRPSAWEMFPHSHLSLKAVDTALHRDLDLRFVRDELTRLLLLLRGSIDGGLNSLSLSKTQWLKKAHPQRFQIIERAGVNVQYLAFNMRDPILKQKAVRTAISLAIDRKAYSKKKYFGGTTPVGSFLAPFLAEAEVIELPFDPRRAEALLDQAKLPRDPKTGIRFELRYKTTPLRDGFELAQYIRACLKPLGILVHIDSVEASLFFSSIRAGGFQLYSSRWVGVSDASILKRTLFSESRSNRVGYRSSEADRLLATEKYRQLQRLMAEDLPYAPLWTWKTDLILSNEWRDEFTSEDVSPSAALEPLAKRRPAR